MADLFRNGGVRQEFAELLEAAGVYTAPELAQRNPENLTAKIKEVNEAKKLTCRDLSLIEMEKWGAEAQTLPRALEY
jgi:hypothetical protein